MESNSNGKATAGLILGIISLVLVFIFMNLGLTVLVILMGIPSILGLIFSIKGLKNASKTKRKRGMAIAGLVLSIFAVTTIMWYIVGILIGLSIAAAMF